MNIYVSAPRSKCNTEATRERSRIRRLSPEQNNSNNSVFVVSDRDVRGATVVSCYPPGVAGAFHVLRVVPFSAATIEELRKCDRVLMPRNGGRGQLLTAAMMQDAEKQLSSFFEFEQMRTYGAAQ